jgi:tRNA A37 N6-isopentenylltransferase MiaA
MPRPVVIVITGPPCAGKTTIARQVAERFSLPWMGKDMVKELLFDMLGWQDREWSKKLSRASVVLLFRFLETQMAARRSCIVESNFKAEYDTVRFPNLGERYEFDLVQIECVCDGQVLFERFKHRAESGERHPGHSDHGNYDEFREMLLRGRSEPLKIGGHRIEIDTTHFGAIDYQTLFAEISQALDGNTGLTRKAQRQTTRG